jgi:hypothetical protein
MNVEDEDAELTDIEKLIFGKWIENFVKERPKYVYIILQFFIKFGIRYPLDVEIKYPDSTQIQVEYKKTGSYSEWWSNGEMKIETTFMNDKLNGGYKKWWSNGEINIETTYVDGKLNGGYKRWYPNGQIEIETTYVNGKIHGGIKSGIQTDN